MKKINTQTIQDTLNMLKVRTRMNTASTNNAIDIKDMVSQEEIEAEIEAKNRY